MSGTIELAQMVANIAAGVYALDAYNDHKDALVDSANESLSRAKDRFKMEKKTKEKVPAAYMWLCEMPEYERCEARAPKVRVRAMRDSYNAARRSALVVGAKGMVGLRRKLAREATVNFIKQTAVSYETFRQIEDNIAQAYVDMKDQGIISAHDGVSSYDPSRVTARTNQLTFDLLQGQADAFNGAAGALGVQASRLLNNSDRLADRQRANNYSQETLRTFGSSASGTDPLAYGSELYD